MGRLGYLILAVLALFSGAVHAAAPAIVVRYASVGGTTDAALYIGMEYGLFRQAGIDFRYQRLDSAAALLGAIATDQLDVAGVSLTPGLFASAQQNIRLRVVGDKESILPKFAATQLLARPEFAAATTRESLQRLKGKTIAVSGKTSVSHFLLGTLLKKHGMTTADVRIVELAYTAQIAALRNKAIDAGVMLEPFLSQAIVNGDAKSISDFVEIVPSSGASIVPIVYSEKFAANRKAGDAFMLAYMRAARIYMDAFNKGVGKDRVIQTVAKHTNFPLAIIRDGNPVGFAANQEVDIGFLEEAQRFYLEQRYLRGSTDVSKLVDSSFAREAVRVLGPYR